MEQIDLNALKERLEQLHYEVSIFDTAKEATEYLNQKVDGVTVGFGGSMTLKEMGLYEALSSHNTLLWHWAANEGMSVPEILAKAQTADVYFSSVNGVAMTGEIINIDGNCNRVAGMLYGHKKVYLVVGSNKVEKDYETALYRARNVAAPLNAKRLNRKTPCVQGGHCFDCKSPERICKALSVLWEKPNSGEYEVVLIKEKMGY